MFVDDIATVAKYHRKLDIHSLQDDVIGDKTIRLKLLSALIRLADCLDIDYRRVHIDRLKILDIPVESKFFWFSYYYVKGMRITNRAIELFFCFPDEYINDQSFTSVISKYILNEINKHIEQVYSILDNYKIRLRRDVESNVQYSTTLSVPLPDNLKEYIKSKMITVTCDELQFSSMNTDIISTNTINDTHEMKNKQEDSKFSTNTAPVSIADHCKCQKSLTGSLSKMECDYTNMTAQEKLSVAEYYIQQFDYEKAIEVVNTIIHSNMEQYGGEDKNNILANCYRLKCDAYKALGGNGNLLFAVLCNKAMYMVLQG